MKKRAPALGLVAIVAIATVFALSGCTPKVGERMVVKLSYQLKLADGTVYDSSDPQSPLEFIYGAGMVVPGLETGLKGLKTGDKKTITVKAADAYGDRDETAVQTVPRSQFPEDMELKADMPLTAQTEQGMLYAIVKEVREKEVVMDFNHPLAGKDLTFDIQIVNVRRATQDEIAKATAAAQSAQ
jgi:FKBP-type peptidyl-prolyl cis-trans isomerase 2